MEPSRAGTRIKREKYTLLHAHRRMSVVLREGHARCSLGLSLTSAREIGVDSKDRLTDSMKGVVRFDSWALTRVAVAVPDAGSMDRVALRVRRGTSSSSSPGVKTAKRNHQHHGRTSFRQETAHVGVDDGTPSLLEPVDGLERSGWRQKYLIIHLD